MPHDRGIKTSVGRCRERSVRRLFPGARHQMVENPAQLPPNALGNAVRTVLSEQGLNDIEAIRERLESHLGLSPGLLHAHDAEIEELIDDFIDEYESDYAVDYESEPPDNELDDDEPREPPFALVVDSDLTTLPPEYTDDVRRAALAWVLEQVEAPAAQHPKQLAASTKHRVSSSLPLADNATLPTWRLPAAAVLSLLGHSPETSTAVVAGPAALRAEARSCALELLLAMGLGGDARVAGRSVLHLLASGGCDPFVYDDVPQVSSHDHPRSPTTSHDLQ